MPARAPARTGRRGAPIGAALLCGVLAAGAADPASSPCAAAAQGAERALNIPRNLLGSIAAVESAGRPWSVNVDGAGRSFDTKQDAIDFVRRAGGSGAHFIDVGCFQIDLFYHRAAFADLDEAFDPGANANYAAHFLSSLRSGEGDGWAQAVADYHSRDPALGDGYRDQVYAALAGQAGLDGLSQPRSHGGPMRRFGITVFGPGEEQIAGAGLPRVFTP